MFFFLPLIFLFCCFLLVRRHLENGRAAVLFSAVITATTLTAITEILSLINEFSFYPLMSTWLFLVILTLKATSPRFKELTGLKINFKTWFLSEKIFLGIILFILTVTALTSAVGSPNTWDSMTYHLSRVAHWVQNKRVGFYQYLVIDSKKGSILSFF